MYVLSFGVFHEGVLDSNKGMLIMRKQYLLVSEKFQYTIYFLTFLDLISGGHHPHHPSINPPIQLSQNKIPRVDKVSSRAFFWKIKIFPR